MIPEPSKDLTASPEGESRLEGESHRRRSHRRGHHRQNSFYETWIRPNRRALKNFALFCAVIILTYFLWSALAAK